MGLYTPTQVVCMYVSISYFLPTVFVLYAVYTVLYEGSYKDNVFQIN
jgi:hypothetical protein